MNDKELEHLLNQEIKNLPEDQIPDRDLWLGISHQLDKQPREYFKATAFAASIVLIVGLGLFITQQAPAPAATNLVMAKLVNILQSDHQNSKQALLVQYQERQAYYPDWENQMAQLEQAEQVIYQALQEDSTNLELLKILRQVQSKQLELIDSVFAPYLRSI